MQNFKNYLLLILFFFINNTFSWINITNNSGSQIYSRYVFQGNEIIKSPNVHILANKQTCHFADSIIRPNHTESCYATHIYIYKENNDEEAPLRFELGKNKNYQIINVEGKLIIKDECSIL